MSETDSIAENSPPSKANGKLLVLLFSAGCGAVLGYLSVGLLGRKRLQMLTLESPGLLLLSIVPIWFFVVLIHELGHVLGGWLCGHRFHMLIVGPLRITRDLSGCRVQLNRTVALSGGIAVCLPTKLDHFVRERMVMVFLGPLASVLLAVLCYWSAYALSQRPSLLVDILTVTALFSTLISCVSLIPNRAGGFPSDGAQLLGLLRRDADSEKVTMIMLVQCLTMSGTRPRDWPAELLEKLNTVKSKQPLYNTAAEFMVYSHHLDRHQYDLAQTHLERAVSNFNSLPNGVRQGFALEAAYFWATHRHDLDKATQWLEHGVGGLVEQAARSRVEAAVHLLKGELQPALEKIREARAHLPASIDRGGAIAEQDMLDAMEAKIKENAATT